MTQGVNAKRWDHLERLKANISPLKCLRMVNNIKVQSSLLCYVATKEKGSTKTRCGQGMNQVQRGSWAHSTDLTGWTNRCFPVSLWTGSLVPQVTAQGKGKPSLGPGLNSSISSVWVLCLPQVNWVCPCLMPSTSQLSVVLAINKIPQTGWLNQEVYSSHFWRQHDCILGKALF